VQAPAATKKSAAPKRKPSDDESDEAFDSDEEEDDESDSASSGDDSEGEPKKATTKKTVAKPDSKKRVKETAKPKKADAPKDAGKDAKKGGKEEKKMMTDKEAKVAIKEYMIKQNRPYSLQNVLDNMQGRVKKSTGTKVLDDLSAEGILTCKEFGKVKVYLANQDNFPTVSTEELAKIDAAIKEAKDHLATRLAKLKDL
jgi:hypothetical protein